MANRDLARSEFLRYLCPVRDMSRPELEAAIVELRAERKAALEAMRLAGVYPPPMEVNWRE